MSLPLPVLDDRRFPDLVTEAQSLIPAYQPSWTDYNASDPGITLIELFAWLAEMLIYRADQVPEAHVRAFLSLLDPNAPSTADLEADVTATVAALRTEYRAVTAADYETHALATDGVARARCVPLRDLSPAVEADRLVPVPATVSVIIVPTQAAPPDPSTVISAVAADLDPRRLITTRVVVVDPILTPIAVHLLLAIPPDVRAADVLTPVENACGTLLDWVTGGASGAGWPFGRPVYVSDLIAAVEALSVVDHVVDIDLTSACDASTARCVEGTEVLAGDGLLIGVALGQEALPQLADPVDVATSAAFVPITAQVNATLDENVGSSSQPAVLASIIRTVRNLAWPGRGWAAGGGAGGKLDSGQINGVVTAIDGVASVQSVTLTSDPIAAPGRVTTATNGIMSVTTGPLELIDLTVEVSLK